jgi:hypothetical protein
MTAGSSPCAKDGKLRIGVSIYVRKGEQSMWENGIYHNCLFLVMFVAHLPWTGQTFLAAGGGDGGPDDAKQFLIDFPVPVVDVSTAMSELDVMIEMSAQLDRAWGSSSAVVAARSCRCV